MKLSRHLHLAIFLGERWKRWLRLAASCSDHHIPMCIPYNHQGVQPRSWKTCAGLEKAALLCLVHPSPWKIRRMWSSISPMYQVGKKMEFAKKHEIFKLCWSQSIPSTRFIHPAWRWPFGQVQVQHATGDGGVLHAQHMQPVRHFLGAVGGEGEVAVRFRLGILGPHHHCVERNLERDDVARLGWGQPAFQRK